MDVDFNNLRIQTMISYDKLCKRLNRAINDDGEINITTDEIQDCMDDLRQCIGVIACVFEKENDDFQMVRDKAIMANFNPDKIEL